MPSLSKFPLLLFYYLVSSTLGAKIYSITSSYNLISGENCYITYVIETSSNQPQPQFVRPNTKINNATLRIYDTRVIAQRGKRIYLLEYQFHSQSTGKFIIPPLKFNRNNDENTSKPITLYVRDKSSLSKHTAESKSVSNPQRTTPKTYTYYTQLITEKSTLFPNEVTNLEYKVYLPKSINIAQWGLPTGEKKNATAWRFETPDIQTTSSDAIIDGIEYKIGRFHTTVSGIKAGKSILGPFKSRVVHQIAMINRMGPFIETQEIFPLSETIELNILDLPPNPPADFKGDVGNFKMSVNIESKNELLPSESIKAEVKLEGRGKFSEITPPSLTNDENWKLISENKRDLGELRKQIESFAEFTYLIQPNNNHSIKATPGFSFSYLDPNIKAYRTLTHPGIPVSIKQHTANSDTPTLTDSSKQMLGIIEGAKLTQNPWYKKLPLSLIHIIPSLICLLLLLKFIQQKHLTNKLKNSHKTIQQQALNELSKKEGDHFIKSASNYIQRWIDTEKHPEFKDIPQLRDDHCYKPNQPIKLSSKRKNAIIDALKKLIIITLIFSPQITEANPDTQWKMGKYEKALTQYQEKLNAKPTPQSADLLYNIGNCHQKLDQTGRAALFYHRALIINPYHNRAKHNLSILQNQNNSIISDHSIENGSLQDWISILSLNTYYILFSLSIWLTLLAILYIKIIKSKKQTLLITLSIFTLCLASISSLCYLKHPNKNKLTNSSFAIIASSTKLTKQPLTESKTLTTLPPASECYIISSRGTYTFIQIADNTQGWVNSQSLLLVQ